jgi:heat shock protein HslJ
VKLLAASFFFSLILAFVASCNSSHKPVANSAGTPSLQISLPGSEWVLTDLAGTPALANVNATLAFPEVGRVAGNGSCNRFTGSVVITGDVLKFGALASTRMACMANDVSRQEDKYLKILGAATRYAYQDPYLLIYADGYDQPLRFSRAPAGKP